MTDRFSEEGRRALLAERGETRRIRRIVEDAAAGWWTECAEHGHQPRDPFTDECLKCDERRRRGPRREG